MHAAQPCWLAEARTRAPRSRRPQPLYTAGCESRVQKLSGRTSWAGASHARRPCRAISSVSGAGRWSAEGVVWAGGPGRGLWLGGEEGHGGGPAKDVAARAD